MLVGASEGYGPSKTGHITLGLAEQNLVAYSFLVIHLLIMLAFLATIMIFPMSDPL